jgi:hypothetical protein
MDGGGALNGYSGGLPNNWGGNNPIHTFAGYEQARTDQVAPIDVALVRYYNIELTDSQAKQNYQSLKGIYGF